MKKERGFLNTSEVIAKVSVLYFKMAARGASIVDEQEAMVKTSASSVDSKPVQSSEVSAPCRQVLRLRLPPPNQGICRTWASVFQNNKDESVSPLTLQDICYVIRKNVLQVAKELMLSRDVENNGISQNIGNTKFLRISSTSLDMSETDSQLAVGKFATAEFNDIVVLDPYVAYLASNLNVDKTVRQVFQHLISGLKAELQKNDIALLSTKPGCPSRSICTSSRLLSNKDSSSHKNIDPMTTKITEVDISESNAVHISNKPSESIRHSHYFVEEAQDVLKKQFWKFGKASNLDYILAEHPQYLQTHVKTMDAVFRGEGPLGMAARHYIALMAASTYKCEYLIRDLATKFRNVGGDRAWLNPVSAKAVKFGVGRSQMPPVRMQQLAQLNSILAHQPWRITPEVIASLTERTAESQLNTTWLLAHLLHAIIIMCQNHMTAAVALVLGVELDADMLTVS